MNIFRALEQRSVPSGYFRGEHSWNLPGITCSRCGEIWATTGVEYPSIDISELFGLKELEKRWVVGVEEFIKLEQTILDKFPQIEVVTPGSSFGPLIGALKGRNFTDFVRFVPWTLLIREIALRALANIGKLNLPETVKVQFDGHEFEDNVFEFQIMPKGTLVFDGDEQADVPPCSVCGRRSNSTPRKLKIHADSIPRI